MKDRSTLAPGIFFLFLLKICLVLRPVVMLLCNAIIGIFIVLSTHFIDEFKDHSDSKIEKNPIKLMAASHL